MKAPQIGIIGAGNMGKIHARVLHNVRALSGVADIDKEKAAQIASKYGVDAFESYEAMIESKGIDGVIISTPTSTHAEIAQSIAEKFDSVRGILIEKPLASTLADANRVAKVLKEKGIGVVVSHSEIYNPVVDRALDLINNGTIGDPRTIIHDRRGHVQPSRIPSLGDVFQDIGVHDFDIMARISHGEGTLYAQGHKKEGVFNSATVMVEFENGTEHVFHLSRQYAGRRRSMDVSGEKGNLILDLFGQIIKLQDLDEEPSADSQMIHLPERGATIKVYGEPVQEVINDFLSSIETGKAPRVGLDDGVAALKIVEAARESANTGKIVDINIEPR
jgi:myo-inositol 2-dehydrogenase/D-chiro-inositol 1-dehydrogenase